MTATQPPLPPLPTAPQPGIYRHKKGGLYLVDSDALSTHSESLEVLVKYYSLKTGREMSRPYDMFMDGRFQLQIELPPREERLHALIADALRWIGTMPRISPQEADIEETLRALHENLRNETG